MVITNLHDFLQRYFKAHYCEIIHNHDGVLTIQLTEEMDRALMNRPFYWHYIKSTGNEGDPMQLTLITNPDKRESKGEWIHFGSPRLQQIMNHLKRTKESIKLFQQVNAISNTALFPWLVTNIKISYNGKQKKDELFSIGLHLINGTMKLEMMQHLHQLPLSTAISDYCYTISPIIKLNSGFIRIENIIDNYIKDQTHQWAVESRNTLNEEVQMVEHFYNKDTEKEQLEKEISEITKRYEPYINYEVINGGIIYLKDDLEKTS